MINAESILKHNMQYYIDPALKQFELPFVNKFKLIPCKSIYNTNNLIMFGIYKIETFNILIKRQQLQKNTIVIWGGSDFDLNRNRVKERLSKLITMKNVNHIAISKCLYERITSVGLHATLIYFNLVDTNLFKPITIKPAKIFIYKLNRFY